MSSCQDDTRMMIGLPRDVIQWLSTLGISHRLRNPKWDFGSGYLVADIFTKYYPRRIELYKFKDSNSTAARKHNWEKLDRFLSTVDIRVPWRLMEGTANFKDDAAILLIIYLFETFTGSRVKMPVQINNPNFMDFNYQRRLPLHARGTTVQSIRRNLKLPEINLHYSRVSQRQKAENIAELCNAHNQRLRQEKPDYFEIQPTIADRALRKAPSASKFLSTATKITVLSSKIVSSSGSYSNTPSLIMTKRSHSESSKNN